MLIQYVLIYGWCIEALSPSSEMDGRELLRNPVSHVGRWVRPPVESHSWDAKRTLISGALGWHHAPVISFSKLQLDDTYVPT
jgi:hypothetical protein